jgi:hypothetical protein
MSAWGGAPVAAVIAKRCGVRLSRIVIDRWVLWALATGVATGDDDAARAALRNADWLVRRRARRRLERAIADAARASGETVVGDPAATRHVLMTAALTVADRFCVPTSPTCVAVEYAAMATPVAPRLWIATLGAAMFVAAAVITLVVTLAWSPRPTVRPLPAPLPPPAAGAFHDGGQPLADPAIAALLAGELVALLGEIDADRQSGSHSARRQDHAAALAGSPAITAHGPALAEAWQAMIAALEGWVDLPSSGAAAESAVHDLVRLTRAVSNQLAAADLGYYLEASAVSLADGAHAIVSSYRIEEVRFVTADGVPRPVLALRRLDHINYEHALLGMQSNELGGAAVLLDQLDQYIASKVMRGLAPGAPYPVGDAAWTAQPVGHQVAVAAGDAVRRELARWLGDDDAETAGDVARLLDERASLLEQWRTSLARRDQGLRRIETLKLPERFLDQLSGSVPSRQLERARAIEAELAHLDAPRIAARLHALVASTIRRHEAQHGVDEDRRRELRYPIQLAEHIGPPARRDGPDRRYQVRVRGELSGYLSQIANDPITPQLAYWDLVASAFSRTAWGTPESYVAVLVSEGLARALKLPSQPLIHDGEVDRQQLATLAVAIADRSDQALRDAAAATWHELFGEPVTRIVDAADHR